MRTRLKWEQAEERAKKILALRVLGKTHREIAAALGLSRDSVAYYLCARCKHSPINPGKTAA